MNLQLSWHAQGKEPVFSKASVCVQMGMLSLEHRHAFAGNGDLLVPYNGPRPCILQRALLHALQQAIRAEEAALDASEAVACDSPSGVDRVLVAFEKHLQRCPDCGSYDLDCSLAD